MFLLVTAALWLGLIDSCREIVKERSIIMRELPSASGSTLTCSPRQALLFATRRRPMRCFWSPLRRRSSPCMPPPATYLDLTGLLILTSWSTVGLGLVVSTVARSVDQATSLIPLLLIPQLLFGGALVALERMGAVIKCSRT